MPGGAGSSPGFKPLRTHAQPLSGPPPDPRRDGIIQRPGVPAAIENLLSRDVMTPAREQLQVRGLHGDDGGDAVLPSMPRVLGPVRNTRAQAPRGKARRQRHGGHPHESPSTSARTAVVSPSVMSPQSAFAPAVQVTNSAPPAALARADRYAAQLREEASDPHTEAAKSRRRRKRRRQRRR